MTRPVSWEKFEQENLGASVLAENEIAPAGVWRQSFVMLPLALVGHLPPRPAADAVAALLREAGVLMWASSTTIPRTSFDCNWEAARPSGKCIVMKAWMKPVAPVSRMGTWASTGGRAMVLWGGAASVAGEDSGDELDRLYAEEFTRTRPIWLPPSTFLPADSWNLVLLGFSGSAPTRETLESRLAKAGFSLYPGGAGFRQVGVRTIACVVKTGDAPASIAQIGDAAWASTVTAKRAPDVENELGTFTERMARAGEGVTGAIGDAVATMAETAQTLAEFFAKLTKWGDYAIKGVLYVGLPLAAAYLGYRIYTGLRPEEADAWAGR